MLWCCVKVEILLIIHHQVARNSRRFDECRIVNLDPSVSMPHLLRFTEVSQPDVRIVSRDDFSFVRRYWKIINS